MLTLIFLWDGCRDREHAYADANDAAFDAAVWLDDADNRHMPLTVATDWESHLGHHTVLERASFAVVVVGTAQEQQEFLSVAPTNFEAYQQTNSEH